MNCSNFPSKNYLDWCMNLLCKQPDENGNGEVPQISCDVGYIYRLEGNDFVIFDEGENIEFQNAIVRGGIGFNPNSPADITINTPGVYKVTFYLNCQSRSIVAIQLNSQTVLPQHTYKNNAASQFIYGQALIEVTNPNTTLTIHVLKDVTLDKTQQNEPQSVNASVLIKRVCALNH
ncbi:hypothetical protein ABG79_00395 [Caloramator mitchellensis]|uniref:Uncharacterized protein n=1 Tax=Caloramator mitchellensis TaxID=908809 RepID=A0A0R3JX09_CALMK|nr:hypothetical protein [Caloramator mitchellensis]KRQ87594.1 hypothetical protein ABG79_00395 [Caloramator mitchellensis]